MFFVPITIIECNIFFFLLSMAHISLRNFTLEWVRQFAPFGQSDFDIIFDIHGLWVYVPGERYCKLCPHMLWVYIIVIRYMNCVIFTHCTLFCTNTIYDNCAYSNNE